MQSINSLKIFFSKKFTDTSLTNKALLNAVTSLLDYGTRLLISLIINPLMVAGLGDYLYGLWQVLSQSMTYITAASGQPTQAIKIMIANRQLSTDYAEKQRSLGSAIIIWLLFLPLHTLVGVIVIWVVPYALKTPLDLVFAVRLTCLILIFNLALSAVAGLPKSVLMGENLGYKRIGLSLIILILGGVVTALAIVWKTGIVGVAIATVITSIASGIVFYGVVKAYIPWFGFRKPEREEIRRFFVLNGWVLLWQLLMNLMLSGDVVFLGLVESPSLVTSYSLTKYLTITVTNILMLVIGNILPGLGGFVGTLQTKKVLTIRKNMMLFVWLIGVVTGVTILAWNRAFLTLWVGEKYFSGSMATALIIILSLQLAYIRLDANIIDLTLNIRTKTLLALCSLTLSLLLSWILMHYCNLGVIGLCIGFILGRGILSFGYPYIIRNFLKVKNKENLIGMLRPIMVFVCLLLPVLGFNSYFKAASWISLIFWSMSTIVTVSVIAFWGGISREDRARFIKRYIHVALAE